MSRLGALFLGAPAVVLLAAACGAGSTSTSTAPTSATAGSGGVPQSAPAPSPTTSISPANGSSTAVLPASFVLSANGGLSPPSVAAPVDTTIHLTVTSHAAQPVTLAVAGDSLTVPARAVAGIQIHGLRKGSYTITVDGAKRGALIVGARPGP